MKTINKNWLWVIAGILLVNVSLLAFILLGGPRHQPPDFLLEKLNFSEEQKEKFGELKGEHRSTINRQRSEIDALKDKLYENFSSKSFTDEEARKITKKIGQREAEGDLLTFQHFREIRNMCTPEQQGKFDRLINEIVRGMNGPIPPTRGSNDRRAKREGLPEGRTSPLR
jgi:Spy/CpxP family protein refolding chaperone